MADKNSGPLEAVQGVVEGVFGKGKVILGAVLGGNDMIKEGHAQLDKADAQRDAAKKEAKAEKARAEAKTYEEREKAEQRSKQ
jgi:hypothetical protein